VTWRTADERPLDVRGFRGWYAAVGQGPPVVIVAPPFARAKTYRPTAARLQDRYRVIVIETPGCGRGSRLPRPWSLDEYAAWGTGALDVLDLDDATVVGHSHSGATVVLMAARSPGRIGRIAVVDSIGAGGPHSLVRTLWGRVVDAGLELDLALTKGHHVLGNAVRHTRNIIAQTRVNLIADVTDECRRVTVPALVAWGARDHILPPRCADEFARHLPRPTIYRSQRGAHEWMIYRPAEFAEVLDQFIGTNPS
jgi:pimeloyl-ACP methyl ester carboxylesterase